MEIIKVDDPAAIEIALNYLEKGKLVIFPSETCYGVAVDATNSNAVSRLLKYKKRPQGKAISIAASNQEMAQKYVNLNSTALKLYDQFLPGAVTIISESKKKVDSRLESENQTLGIRIPAYKFLLDLIEKFGKPVTATSANSSGKKTPYRIKDILDNLNSKQAELIDLIIDAGELPKNPPTTVLDTTTDDLKIYRQGRIDPSKVKSQQEFKTSSVEDTIKAGEEFINSIIQTPVQKPIVILLNGELGAGKTHFTKGIALGLNIDRVIKSPTYNYVNEYKIPELTDRFYHMDAWRIESLKDLEILGFNDWFKNGNVIVIEWPSVVMNLDKDLFENIEYFYIDFILTTEDTRDIKIFEI